MLKKLRQWNKEIFVWGVFEGILKEKAEESRLF